MICQVNLHVEGNRCELAVIFREKKGKEKETTKRTNKIKFNNEISKYTN